MPNHFKSLLKVLSHTDWVAERTILLLQLYRPLIRSKLDYGNNVNGTARKLYLDPLDSMH